MSNLLVQSASFFRSSSYRPCHCGGECYIGTQAEPCWGRVSAVDRYEGEDDTIWIHACEGHEDIVGGYSVYYTPEPKS